MTLSCPPLDSAPDENRDFKVRFTQDASGLLEVEATVSSTGEQSRIVIERGDHSLDEVARKNAVEALQRLKLHPREWLPNRHLLEQANNLYEALGLDGRHQLDALLFEFEKALDHGDSARIQAARRALEAAVRALA